MIKCNESALTGEPEDILKTKNGDCFLKSSCLITEGERCRALVTNVGVHSTWGSIKATLASDSVSTPLQDRLGSMTETVLSPRVSHSN